ncbi:hypothetical protein ACMGDH_17910 [Sphingomonas sp. DT-207]|uniref:hypothetical protein n=1 Tax=Sphingomonas sp. DT-207 TaxID=3396167 RepID=UPI003F1E0D8F
MIAIALQLFFPAAGAWAQSQPAPKAGETFEIIRSYETSEETSGGSSGSSRGHSTLYERVIAVRDGGLELEYDLEEDATPEERRRNWQLPARVFKPSSGPMQLLNVSELEMRLDGWLKAGEWDRSVCGRWIFTWTAFHIDCDPQSIIGTIEEVDLRSHELREGALFHDPMARKPGILTAKPVEPDGMLFTTLLEVDPNAMRRERAEADVITGEILQKPTTLDAALGERAKEQVSGTISVTLEADAAGQAWKRTKVSKVQTARPGGESENRTAKEIVERRRIPTVPVQK